MVIRNLVNVCVDAWAKLCVETNEGVKSVWRKNEKVESCRVTVRLMSIECPLSELYTKFGQ